MQPIPWYTIYLAQVAALKIIKGDFLVSIRAVGIYFLIVHLKYLSKLWLSDELGSPRLLEVVKRPRPLLRIPQSR
jgi:hypothetical protein